MSDQHWNPDSAWAPPDSETSYAPPSQPAAPTPPAEAPPAAPTATPPAASWWGSAPVDPQATQPTPPVAPTPPAAPSWPPQPPTPPSAAVPPSGSSWSPDPTPSWTPPAATSWPPQPPSAVTPPPGPPSGGGWGTAGWEQPPSPRSSTTTGKRVLAAIAAVALVLASAGIGAVVAVAVHDNNGSSSTAFPNVPSFGGNGSNGNGVNPGGSGSNGNGSRNGSSSSGSINASAIASSVTPAIVNINTTLAQGRAAGTGIVISSSGAVLTNNHVIADATSIKVDIGGTGNTHSAHVVGYDVQDDVALVQIEGVSNLKTATFGDPSQVRVGDPVVAIGRPFGLQETVTSGIVSALHRQITSTNQATIENAIQTDAAINHGNSGGPLLDAQARVVGVNAQIESESGGSDGVGFAVPASSVRQLLSQV